MGKSQVGELFMLGFRGTKVPAWLQEFEQRYGLGGVLLFDYDCESRCYERNIVSAQQVADLCDQVHQLESRPLVYIDQEGGKVRRLKEELGFASLVSAWDFNKLSRHERLAQLRQSYTEMRSLGIDFNLGPVVDINTNPTNPDIGRSGRSYSADPAEIMACVEDVDRIAKEVGIGLCLKHYPGVGGATTNSHVDLLDLTPFHSDIHSEIFHKLAPQINQSAVLVSHGTLNTVEHGIPASVSPKLLETLRRKVPDVLIVTDDLQMQGLQKIMTTQEACLRAVAAGADLLIIGNNLLYEAEASFDIARSIVERAEKDAGFAANVDAAVRRIQQRKAYFKMKC